MEYKFEHEYRTILRDVEQGEVFRFTEANSGPAYMATDEGSYVEVRGADKGTLYNFNFSLGTEVIVDRPPLTWLDLEPGDIFEFDERSPKDCRLIRVAGDKFVGVYIGEDCGSIVSTFGTTHRPEDAVVRLEMTAGEI